MSRPKPQGKTRLQHPGGHISRLGYLLDLDRKRPFVADTTNPPPAEQPGYSCTSRKSGQIHASLPHHSPPAVDDYSLPAAPPQPGTTPPKSRQLRLSAKPRRRSRFNSGGRPPLPRPGVPSASSPPPRPPLQNPVHETPQAAPPARPAPSPCTTHGISRTPQPRARNAVRCITSTATYYAGIRRRFEYRAWSLTTGRGARCRNSGPKTGVRGRQGWHGPVGSRHRARIRASRKCLTRVWRRRRRKGTVAGRSVYSTAPGP